MYFLWKPNRYKMIWYKCYTGIYSFEEVQAGNPESSSLYVHSRENTLNYTNFVKWKTFDSLMYKRYDCWNPSTPVRCYSESND